MCGAHIALHCIALHTWAKSMQAKPSSFPASLACSDALFLGFGEELAAASRVAGTRLRFCLALLLVLCMRVARAVCSFSRISYGPQIEILVRSRIILRQTIGRAEVDNQMMFVLSI